MAVRLEGCEPVMLSSANARSLLGAGATIALGQTILENGRFPQQRCRIPQVALTDGFPIFAHSFLHVSTD